MASRETGGSTQSEPAACLNCGTAPAGAYCSTCGQKVRSLPLVKRIAKQLKKAKKKFWETKRPARCFRDFQFRTLKSWSRSRRVVGKAEQVFGKENPRFVVTSLSRQDYPAQELYEDVYCVRGDMENRIKKQQLCLLPNEQVPQLFRQTIFAFGSPRSLMS